MTVYLFALSGYLHFPTTIFISLEVLEIKCVFTSLLYNIINHQGNFYR